MKTKEYWLKEVAKYYGRGGYTKKYLVWKNKEDFYFTDELLTTEEKVNAIECFGNKLDEVTEKYKSTLKKQKKKFKEKNYKQYIRCKAKEYFWKNIAAELIRRGEIDGI